LGLLADMQSFIASFTALRGNIQGLITTPDRLALAFKGIFQGIQRLPAYPQPEQIQNRACAPGLPAARRAPIPDSPADRPAGQRAGPSGSRAR